jgi:hypothetical protein
VGEECRVNLFDDADNIAESPTAGVKCNPVFENGTTKDRLRTFIADGFLVKTGKKSVGVTVFRSNFCGVGDWDGWRPDRYSAIGYTK